MRWTHNRAGRIAIGAVVAAGIAFGAVQLVRPHARGTDRQLSAGPQGLQGVPGPTVDFPLGYSGDAKKTTLAAADCNFGFNVPEPDTRAVGLGETGAVWDASASGQSWVALTYPSKDLFISYHRPGGWGSDPERAWQGDVKAIGSGARVIHLAEATPALETDENADLTGANYGAVVFVVNDTEVDVYGHVDAATLEATARSILGQWPTNSDPGPPVSSGPTGKSGPTGSQGATGTAGEAGSASEAPDSQCQSD